MFFGNCACQVKKSQFGGSSFYIFMIQYVYIHVTEQIGAEFLPLPGKIFSTYTMLSSMEMFMSCDAAWFCRKRRR